MNFRIRFGTSRHSGSAPQTKAGGCVMTFVFLMFASVGGVLFVLLFVLPCLKYVQARSWQPTPCTVVSSEVKESHDDDGTTYRVHVVFHYEFGGQKYESDRYNVSGMYTSGRKNKQAIVNLYRPGTKAECYVDSENPSSAVLDRSFPLELWLGLFPLLFLGVGCIGLIYVVLRKKTPATRFGTEFGSAAAPIAGEIPRDAGDESSPSDEWSEEDWLAAAYAGREDVVAAIRGPVTLKSKWSPLFKFLGMLGVAVFWNGIVSVFVTMSVHGFIAGKPEWCLTVFLIPFVVIGLVLIFAVGHTFLAMFNPRPIVTLTASVATLGSKLDMSWRFRGQTGSLRRLVVTLEGKESATYRRGTSTTTDKNTFAKIVCCDTTNFLDIAQGMCEVPIPPDSMHTFVGGRNTIQWVIHLVGEISWWPDVDEEFPITVLPYVQYEKRGGLGVGGVKSAE